MINGRTNIERKIRHGIILLSFIIFHSLAEKIPIKKSRLRCNLHKHKDMMIESDSDGIFIWSGYPETNFKVEQNSTVRLNCRDVRFTTISGIVRRSPPVLFKWKKDDNDVTKTNENLQPFGCKLRPRIMDPRLLIKNIQVSDQGRYSCHLMRYDTNEEVLSRSFEIQVEHNIFNYRPWLIIGITLLILPTFIAAFCFRQERIRKDQKKWKRKFVGHGMYIGPHKEGELLDSQRLKESTMAPWGAEIRWEEVIRGSSWDELFTISSLDLKSIKEKEISRDCLECVWKENKPHLLGSGFFGHVYKGVLKFDNKPDEQVAVKVLKDRFRYEDLYYFFEEASTLIKAGSHENLISLVGTCLLDAISLQNNSGTVHTPVLVMELATGGSLLSFLLQYRELSTSDVSSPYSSYCGEVEAEKLLSFSLQVARGMEHLSSKNILHRDLAARNILLTSNEVVKIGDFGLSKHVQNKGYYKIQNRWEKPVKWTSPEALVEDRYTMQSDVWSFGVLIWEIFTLGEEPYPTIPPKDLYRSLIDGLRLSKPYLASEKIYNIMLSCWSWVPQDRPSFTEIAQQLSDVNTVQEISTTIDWNELQLGESTKFDISAPLGIEQTSLPLSVTSDNQQNFNSEQNCGKIQKTASDKSSKKCTRIPKFSDTDRKVIPPKITINNPDQTSLSKCSSDGLIFQNHAYFNVNHAYSSQIILPQGSDGESLPTTPTSVYNVNQSSSSGDYCFYDETIIVNSRAIKSRYNDIC